MMLTPIGTPLTQDLQDRGRHILDTLQGLHLDQQLDLALRTILAVTPWTEGGGRVRILSNHADKCEKGPHATINRFFLEREAKP